MTAEERMFSAFKNKRIMIVVPHEDDEINVAGTLLAVKSKYSIDIRVVFTTDGGVYVAPKRRQKEALHALKYCGLEERDISFLGYSDFESNDKARSKEEREKLSEDLLNCILAYRPDFIFANDCDSHPNHKELSELVDSLIKMIKDEYDYCPVLIKTYAYDLAYKGVDDYSSFNLAETKNIGTNPSGFDWDSRLRLPVPKKCRTRYISSNFIFRELWHHHSQTAFKATSRIANSDKVYWVTEKNDTYSSEFWFGKICINNNYVYDFYTDDTALELEFVAFDMKGNRYFPEKDKIQYYITDKNKKNKCGHIIEKSNCLSKKVTVSVQYDGNEVDRINVIWGMPTSLSLSINRCIDKFAIEIMKIFDWTVNEIYRVNELMNRLGTRS